MKAFTLLLALGFGGLGFLVMVASKTVFGEIEGLLIGLMATVHFATFLVLTEMENRR